MFIYAECIIRRLACFVCALVITTCRESPSDKIEDEIKTITYDEYVNAGIPDALLEGLGLAEYLSEQPMDDDNNDAEETEAADVDLSDGGVQSQPNVVPPNAVPPVPMVPVSLMQLLGSHVGSSENSHEMLTSNNIVSDTPSTVNLVDKHGNILPTLPPTASSLVRTAMPSSLVAGSNAPGMTYMSVDGTVLPCLPYTLPITAGSSNVRMVDKDGRIITNNLQTNTKNGRVGPGVTTVRGSGGITKTSESVAGNFRTSLSASSVSASGEKQKQPTTYRNSIGNVRSNSEYCGSL